MAPSKKSTENSPSKSIEKDQDDLMNTLESIRGLLEQSEGKLNAARESITIANTNTQNDTSALLHIRNNDLDEEIVPILDEVVELDTSSDSLINIPELDAVFTAEDVQTEMIIEDVKEELSQNDTQAELTPDLADLTQKNLLIDALDELQLDLEQSLRETLMKTMVSLEKDLKDRISNKIEQIKSDILD